MEYARTVGELLPTILTEILLDLRFNVIVKSQRANGVDMKIYFGDSLFAVAEVLNWSIGSRLTVKRRDKIIENLNEFSCHKILVHTVPLINLHGIQEHGIQRIEIGYQILPEEYYNFYSARRQTIRRKADNPIVRAEIANKVMLHLIRSRLIRH